jgi:hypothetical protein
VSRDSFTLPNFNWNERGDVVVNPYDGGQAFPSACADGMSYRMWLVGLALQGLMAQPDDNSRSFEVTATLAVHQADKAIAAQGLKDPHARESP